MTDREAMQMALDALNNFDKGNHGMRWQVPVIKALRAALAQPEPEPVAWMYSITGVLFDICPPDADEGEFLPLYTAPPRREWVGLTDGEYELMAEKRVTNYFFNTLDYAHDIEAKLKEKNETN